MSSANNIAIICARGGSKGVPGKNIRDIAGMPLIAHTIIQAQNTQIFSHVVVSSDDDDILAVAKKYGATTLKRPAEMATDEAGVMPAVEHCLAHIEAQESVEFDLICLLQTTSPLRTADDILGAATQLKNGDKDNIFSVCEASASPYYNMVERDADGKIALCKNADFVRRQDAPAVYELNGAIYIWKRASFMNGAKVLGDNSDMYVMSPERSVDIDAEFDFQISQFLMEERNNAENKGNAKAPASSRATIIAANELRKEKKYAEAIEALQHYLKQYPFDHAALYHLGLNHLFMGNFDEGLHLASHRSFIESFYPDYLKEIDVPVWDGTPTKDKVVVWSTVGPGIGTEIMLLSFLGEIANIQKNLLVICEPRLLATLRRSFPQVKFCGYADLGPNGKKAIRYHCALSALPSLYLQITKAKKIKTEARYLIPDVEFSSALRKKYHAEGDDKKLIGLSWYTTNAKSSAERSVPEEMVRKFSSIKNAKLISLQHGYDAGALRDNGQIIFDDDVDPIHNLDGLIAQISAMDAVITIDNSVAYIAAALNIPTALMLSDGVNWTWKMNEKNKDFCPSVQLWVKGDQGWDAFLDSIIEHFNAPKP